ncbi:MAG TPA: galactokinase [Desulfovibrio sp.]|nr:galactokinase [Desulfovibrio sp.]
MKVPEQIPAIILAGGKGTRLRSVVADRPKVLAPVYGRPYIFHLLDQLKRAGVAQVILSTGYMADMVENVVGYGYENISITYSRESEALGTGGGIRLASLKTTAPTILALNGDSYCGVDLRAYFNWFFGRERSASMLLTEVENCDRFGQVKIDAEERVTSFVEKGAGSGSALINAGIYLLRRDVLERIPAGGFVSIENDVFPGLLGYGVFGYVVKAPFLDIGTPESFRSAEFFFKQQQEMYT